MYGINKLYKLLIGNIVSNPLGVVAHANNPPNSTLTFPCNTHVSQGHDSTMAKALIAVFGMGKDGRIEKEKACKVVKQLGLVDDHGGEGDEDSGFDIGEEELEVKGVLSDLEEEEKREKNELLRQVFLVFDEDGDGYIDAMEIKRIFGCLGLDNANENNNGWEMSEIEKMIRVVDLNLDGKVDFHEFELMMMG